MPSNSISSKRFRILNTTLLVLIAFSRLQLVASKSMNSSDSEDSSSSVPDESTDFDDEDEEYVDDVDPVSESVEQKTIVGAEKDFYTAALDSINFYRSNHGVPSLVLDPALNTKAQAWADNLASTNSLDYSCKSKCGYGESIALIEPNENLSAAARSAIQLWYKQGLKFSYKYGAPSPTIAEGKNVLDFTAMLWKSTKKVGFGLAEDKNGEIIFVANYVPIGNVLGAYGKNVLP